MTEVIGDYSYGAGSNLPITWRHVVSLTAFLCLLLDHASLFSTEVKYIWRSKFRLSKCLFVFSRYFPLVVHIVNYTLVHRWLHHSPISTPRCQAWYFFLGFACSASVIVMDTISLLRIYALYLKNPLVWLLSVPLLAEHVLAQVVIGRSTFINPSFSEYCDLDKTPKMVVALGIITILSHFGLWFAIYVKRKASQAAVVSLVVKESHLALGLFIAPFFLAMPWSINFKPNPFVIFVWPITIFSITSCRIFLNMLQLKTETASTDSISATDFLFTTILDSRVDSRVPGSHELASKHPSTDISLRRTSSIAHTE